MIERDKVEFNFDALNEDQFYDYLHSDGIRFSRNLSAEAYQRHNDTLPKHVNFIHKLHQFPKLSPFYYTHDVHDKLHYFM